MSRVIAIFALFQYLYDCKWKKQALKIIAKQVNNNNLLNISKQLNGK